MRRNATAPRSGPVGPVCCTTAAVARAIKLTVAASSEQPTHGHAGIAAGVRMFRVRTAVALTCYIVSPLPPSLVLPCFMAAEPRGSEERIEDVLLRFKQAVRGEGGATIAGGAETDARGGKAGRRQKGRNSKVVSPRQAERMQNRNEQLPSHATEGQSGAGNMGKRKGAVRRLEQGMKKRKENEPAEEGEVLGSPPTPVRKKKRVAGGRVVGQELNLEEGNEGESELQTKAAASEPAAGDDAWAQVEAFRRVCEAGGDWEEAARKRESEKQQDELAGGTKHQQLNGALMLAVCRGKVRPRLGV